MTGKKETDEKCGGCGHRIIKERPDCPDCDRIARETPDKFTPCAKGDA